MENIQWVPNQVSNMKNAVVSHTQLAMPQIYNH